MKLPSSGIIHTANPQSDPSNVVRFPVVELSSSAGRVGMHQKLILPFLIFSVQLCVLSLFLAVPLPSQIMNVPDEQQKGEYKLSGIVVNSVTGEPIRRALVRIYVGQQTAVLTDSEGKFAFDDLPPTNTEIEVRKPGYFTEREAFHDDSANQRITIGPDTLPVILKLVPEAVIFGRVESNGEPVENLPMKVMALRINEGRKTWVQQAGEMTDADGAFRIPNLIPGTYYLSAGPHWDQPAPGATKYSKGFAEVFYDNADDLAGATPIQLAAGQQTEADFSIKSPPLFQVSGTINVPPGQSANLSLLNWAGAPLSLPTRFMPNTGEFQTAAPAGSYILKAQSFGQNSIPMSATLPLHVNSDISGLRLVLTQAITIPVYVQKQNVAVSEQHTHASSTTGGVDVNGKLYTVVSNDGSMVNIILREEGVAMENRIFYSTYRVVDGTPQMEIENIEPGKYLVAFSTGGGTWYVQSAQCGSVDLLHEDLAITAGAQPPPIDIVVRDDAASLEWGITSDGQSVPGTILLIPDGYPARTRMLSSGIGRATSYGFAPGDYSILAVDHAQNLEYTNPEVIGPYLTHAQHVSLQPGQKTEVDLELVKVKQ